LTIEKKGNRNKLTTKWTSKDFKDGVGSQKRRDNFPLAGLLGFASVSANTAKDVILYPFYFAKNSIFFKQTTTTRGTTHIEG